MKLLFFYKKQKDTENTELVSIIELKMEENKISGKMMKNILQIKRVYVEDIIIPRNEIIYINFSNNFQEIKKEILFLNEEL